MGGLHRMRRVLQLRTYSLIHSAVFRAMCASSDTNAPAIQGSALLASAKPTQLAMLHYADLPESDIKTAQGFKFTRPLRTILDLVEAGTVEHRFIRQALRQALDRGVVTRHEIQRTRMSEPARKFIEDVLRRTA